MDLSKKQFVFILALSRKISVKRLDDVCKDFLFKRYNVEYFIERPADLKISVYCLIDEFFTEACQKVFHFCKCQNWEYKPELVNFCDWCLFYKEFFVFCIKHLHVKHKKYSHQVYI